MPPDPDRLSGARAAWEPSSPALPWRGAEPKRFIVDVAEIEARAQGRCASHDGLLFDFRFRHDALRLHRLGARPPYELLAELGCNPLIRTKLKPRVERFARLDLAALGADQFAPATIRFCRSRPLIPARPSDDERGQRPDAGPTRATELPSMRLISWKPLIKNSLRGFCSIELPIGLKVHDVPVLVSNGKTWASLPSKPVLDREGQHAEVSGKKQYASILEWRDRELANRFSDAVLNLVRAQHPEALDGGGS
jgi:hypothetical protein